MSSEERRRQFGVYLAGLRRAAGKSQRQLAGLLCALSGTASVTRNEVSRWERGARVPEAWLPCLAQAFGVPLLELEQAASYARGEEWARLPGAAASLSALLPEGDPLRQLQASTWRRIDEGAVTGLAGRVHALRLADDVLSGGDLIRPAFRELRSALALYREASFSDGTGRALLVQIGELGQIAGWVASDAGRLEDAERAYRLGLDAARQAGDGPLAANLAGSLAYQWSNNGREREGVDLAEAAVREAGDAAGPAERALFFDRVAWAHTRAGDAQPAMRALGEAHDALSAEAAEQPPQWAYWVSRDELEVMDARVFTELRRPLRAVPLLSRVLDRYDATHARELALYRSWLAVALADANEPEQAAAEAKRIIDLSGDLSSDRTAERTRIVLQRLQPFADVPEVRRVLAEHGHLLLARG
ncbi:helix-turn-helix domain-containing protein [Streptomyces sp. NPDC058291]|uniref:helix-turn-helix domain-containing protein n=1 Tax=Streptomyces sp. NPDC058291 TaxID=3346427 RepID=UPI0036E7BCA6